MSELECVLVGPHEGHDSTVIWLHGLGASGHDFEPVAPLFEMPNTRFVFPHAPRMAVTINAGMRMPAWYDIKHLNWGQPDREDEASIRMTADLVAELLAEEHARGVPYERIVLAGFSQGGALARHVGLRASHKLAGIMCLSTYEVLADTRDAEAHDANATTPMLVQHGRFDDMVPMPMGQAAHARDAEGREVRWDAYNMGHEVCMQQIRDIRDWLHTVLPQSSSSA